VRKALRLQRVDHRRDQRIDIAFAFPEIEGNIEKPIIHFQRSHGHVDEMLQQCPIPRTAGLHFCDRVLGALGIGLIFLRPGRRHWVEP